jgi:hypothetical protein
LPAAKGHHLIFPLAISTLVSHVYKPAWYLSFILVSLPFCLLSLSYSIFEGKACTAYSYACLPMEDCFALLCFCLLCVCLHESLSEHICSRENLSKAGFWFHYLRQGFVCVSVERKWFGSGAFSLLRTIHERILLSALEL